MKKTSLDIFGGEDEVSLNEPDSPIKKVSFMNTEMKKDITAEFEELKEGLDKELDEIKVKLEAL